MAGRLKTYVDSCLIIAAAKGNEPHSAAAFDVLSNPARQLVATKLVVLETLPAPYALGYADQARFTERVFELVTRWLPVTDALLDEAIALACAVPHLKAVDALHACAARALDAELVTLERRTGPFSRVPGLRVSSLLPVRAPQTPAGP